MFKFVICPVCKDKALVDNDKYLEHYKMIQDPAGRWFSSVCSWSGQSYKYNSIQFEVYIAYFQSADSYHSFPQLPKAVFTSKEEAENWVAEQPGYGLDTDWFVKALPLIGRF